MIGVYIFLLTLGVACDKLQFTLVTNPTMQYHIGESDDA